MSVLRARHHPGRRSPFGLAAADWFSGLFGARPSLARLRIGDRVGEIVMGIIERLHLGGAIVALVARRDAFGIAGERVDDLGDGGRIAIGEGAAIGFVGIRGCQQRERDQAGGETMQPGFPPVRRVHKGPRG